VSDVLQRIGKRPDDVEPGTDARLRRCPLMAWFIRFSAKLAGVLALMLLVEFASFLLYRDRGVMRLLWLPLSYACVAFAGYDTVKRLPLIWGALVGAFLAGVTSLVSWQIGAFVMDGTFRMPEEADPLIVATGFFIAAIVGAIVASVAGMIARDRRRHRSRRTAMGKLAYTAFDESPDPDGESRPPIPLPMAERGDRR
jgi:hypothetical protein